MGRTKERKPRVFIKPKKQSGIISRQEWGAAEPVSQEPLQLPVYNVMIKFYTDSPPCDNREDCKLCLQELQKRYMDQGLPDIPYNFIIAGDDEIYEGRGWFVKPTKVDDDLPEWDGTSLDIAYLGQRDRDIYLTWGGSAVLRMAQENNYLAEDFTFEVISGTDKFELYPKEPIGFPDKEMSASCGHLLELGVTKKCIVGMFNFEILRGIDEVPDRLKTFLKIDDY